ncbi:FMN reductase (NADPH) [Terribacillus saccharophilus]|uniref:NADPH-dependent FMN reductase n=1 Tax=Terribacillus saccharophilus TaxID=361277 RepID=UPI000BA6A5B2|nr:NADPH-dependent FMN reductase [Terribacillus saccharophilus]PAF16083.1 FMN reductase (NADPH) [Terribacillus saccharophilus]PAF21380.1 FMN reductase (NADPH) [Terribacillus saccharophilus]PAF35980.1 FMN reductase (NADPH) [Terribacillus saccharophilus]
MAKITIVTGGNSIHSRLTGVLNHVQRGLEEDGMELDVIQVHQLPSNALLTADFSNEEIVEAIERVKVSDGVVFLTPVYKAAYSGILKTFLDLLPQKVLQGKAVLPLALGGTYGHLLVLDYALKPVIQNLGATVIHTGVFVLDKQVMKQEENQYALDLEAVTRLNSALALYKKSIGGRIDVYHTQHS